MVDGLYQSAVVFFMAYLLFSPANFVTHDGLGIDDTKRIGVFIASSAVVVVNLYILFNTYRWDWLMVLIVTISLLLFWFWTGVYTATTAGFSFYQAAPQVFASLSYWALLLLTAIICLLPRLIYKVIQKAYFPLDTDIIREQVGQGKFDYLKNDDSFAPAPPDLVSNSQASSTDDTEAASKKRHTSTSDDLRPIYPPSVAPTATTHNTRTQNGSDGTDYTEHSLEPPPHLGSAMERQVSRPSFDRARMSMDRIRPSFEQSHDFTSASRLMRLESSQSGSGSRWKRRLTRSSETKSEADHL